MDREVAAARRTLPLEDELCAPKSIARAWVLLLLYERPAHGYELIARLADFHFHSPPSRVYRALNWLDKAGLVEQTWETDGRGPARRVYTTKPDATWILEVIAPRLYRSMNRVHPAFACHLRSLLSDISHGVTRFTFSVKTRMTVDATDERSARSKLDYLFRPPRSLDVGVQTIGELRVEELVEATAPGAGSAMPVTS